MLQACLSGKALSRLGLALEAYAPVDLPAKPFSIKKAARLLTERPSLRLRSPRALNAAYERVTEILRGLPAPMASLLSAFDWLGTPLPWIEFCNYAPLLSQLCPGALVH